MDRFELVTDLAPKGDQPQAIDVLTKGVEEGKKFQTLLGVTGSGKSLPPKELVWSYEQADFGLNAKLVPIGDFVDQLMSGDISPTRQGDTETLFLAGTPAHFTLSINPETLKVEIKPVTAVLRHQAPQTLWRLETTCGRSVRVTGDHNLWVLRDGELKLLETHEVRVGDYLPLPFELPEMQGLSAVSAAEALRDDRRIFLDPNFPPANREPRLHLNDALKLRTDGAQFDLEQASVTLHHGGRSMPLAVPISNDLLELLGFYIAEGHAEDQYFMISCQEPDLQRRLERCLTNLGLTWRVRSNGYDYVIAWSLYARLLHAWCGATSREKRLPDFWPELNRAQLSRLLATYYAGDGGVEHDEVTVTTASAQLASQLGYALTSFGLWPRMSRRFKRATNSDHRGDFYYRIGISGAEQLKRFSTQINFSSLRKSRLLKSCLDKRANTNVDVIPFSPCELEAARAQLGWTQRALATRAGCVRSMISLIESGHRRPSRTLFLKLIEAIEEGALQQERLTLGDQIVRWRQLTRVRWTPVSSLTQEPSNCQWVYDLSVPDNETFLAGFGGLFVHNTFTIAHVIANVNRPTLVISHNKTLAAQLYSEFKSLFPNNAVEYFVSYYDYYQPEAYVPQTDTYIEKDSSVNDDLDRLRLSATSSLLTRRDTIIVATVSCIYSLGDPEEYKEQMAWIVKGKPARRDELLSWLIGIHYARNDVDFRRGTFRARGEVVDIFPAYLQHAYRVELSNGSIARIRELNPTTGEAGAGLEQIAVYPAKHFVTNKERLEPALEAIRAEMVERVRDLQAQGKLLEAQRLESRTKYDLEMLKELGFCHGVENYSRPLSGRAPGSRPHCLIDYFPKDYLMVVDESHATIPQVRGMYEGDRARKETLVEYGFRLPSALDNRPQRFDEFESLMNQVVFISATPSPYELTASGGTVAEQLIRPTGLVDPAVTIQPTEGQIDDLIARVRERAARQERVLVTTLTKRMAEDLTR